MRFEDDDYLFQGERRQKKAPKNNALLVTCVVCVCMMITVLAVVLLNARDKDRQSIAPDFSESDEEDFSVTQQKLDPINAVEGTGPLSEDLEFWEDYSYDSNIYGLNKTNETIINNENDELPVFREPPPTESTSGGSGASIDETNDGEHTKVTLRDKTVQWLSIDPYIPRNGFDFSGLVYNEPVLKYYENSKKSSFFGVTISKSSGNVDFIKLKESGAEFCIIRIGSRGFSGGQILYDDTAAYNASAALAAGMQIGFEFLTFAISIEEVEAEKQFVLNFLAQNMLKPVYPIVYRFESVAGDKTRADELTKDERSELITAFVEGIEAAGYTACVFADKEWLPTKMNSEILKDCGIFLNQAADIPDYPYRFSMWQYKANGVISGIPGEAALNISFVDYSMK